MGKEQVTTPIDRLLQVPPSYLTKMFSAQYSLCATLDSHQTPASDSRCPRPHPERCQPPDPILLPMRDTSLLAADPPLPHLHHLLQRPPIRRPFLPVPVPPLLQNLVSLCLLLPRPPTPLRPTLPDPKIHLRLPPAWDHLPRGLRRLWHRIPRFLPALPRHHQHPSHPRHQLPCPILPRICPIDGPSLRFPRVMREHSFQRWVEQRRHGPRHHHRRRRRP